MGHSTYKKVLPLEWYGQKGTILGKGPAEPIISCIPRATFLSFSLWRRPHSIRPFLLESSKRIKSTSLGSLSLLLVKAVDEISFCLVSPMKAVPNKILLQLTSLSWSKIWWAECFNPMRYSKRHRLMRDGSKTWQWVTLLETCRMASVVVRMLAL